MHDGEQVQGPATNVDLDERDVERALVDRARTDRAAFAQLYRMHLDAVYGFAFRRCGSKDVAEEATSSTFERALRSLDQFQWREGGMRPWLLRIASNEVAEHYRRAGRADGRRGQVALRDLVAVGDDEPGAAEPVDLAVLHDALDRLPERYRAVVSLRYLAGLSADDAAAELDCSKRVLAGLSADDAAAELECSKRVLAVTLHRALGALRREMERHESKVGV